MYRYLIRTFLFILPPETIHQITVSCVKFLLMFPCIKKLFKKLFFIHKKENMSVEFAGLRFESRIGLAAGFDKNADFFNQFYHFGFSFIETGTITPMPQPGNPKPRSFRIKKDSAIINRMGFNNLGVDKAVENLKRKREKKLIIGGNIGKNTNTPNSKAVQDYTICFKKLYNYVDYFVVNVSCPNISNLSELQDPKALKEILAKLVNIRKLQEKRKPILLKISPDLDFKEIDEIIDICRKVGIDGIVATNTTTRRLNLKTNERKIQSIGNGGLSGKPLASRSTDIIRYISDKSGNTIPIIGVGGIMTPEDAMEKIKAGATLIQIYTGFVYEGPFLAKRINKYLLKNTVQD